MRQNTPKMQPVAPIAEITEPLAIKDRGDIARFNAASARNLQDMRAMALNINEDLLPKWNASVEAVNAVLDHLPNIDATGKVAQQVCIVAQISGSVAAVSTISDAVVTTAGIHDAIVTDAANSIAIRKLSDYMVDMLHLLAGMPTMKHVSDNMDAVQQASQVVSATGTICTTMTGVLARVAKTELRMTRVELELLKLMGNGSGGGSGSGSGTAGTPTYDPETGAYRGPVAVGTSILDMQDAGVLFLFKEGASEDEKS